MKTDINPLPFRYAWTGGDVAPSNLYRESKLYRQLCSFFFRESLRLCGGLDMWHHMPDPGCNPPLGRARLFWNHARLDAWATFREYSPRPGVICECGATMVPSKYGPLCSETIAKFKLQNGYSLTE